ncbi:hypothetical protein B4135_3168 [Caldibacillus debilis]|uniref:Uncharacterized protein n=1 Tax=Caldibacillus debilis TaxID=301148 RepID=A0A150LHL9_9BACI|nr:hypothetical protein B4135_3168 [Caldibacillus debilis]
MTDCFGKRADEAEAPPEGAVRPGVEGLRRLKKAVEYVEENK